MGLVGALKKKVPKRWGLEGALMYGEVHVLSKFKSTGADGIITCVSIFVEPSKVCSELLKTWVLYFVRTTTTTTNQLKDLTTQERKGKAERKKRKGDGRRRKRRGVSD